MQITLITFTYSKLNLGVRYISSFLKKKGHDVQIIFLQPDFPSNNGIFTDQIAEQIVTISKDSVLYGISLFTLDLPAAIKITQLLKNIDSKIVLWGGMHATLDPEECIRYCDMVCIGEGEKVLADLLNCLDNKNDYHQIDGLWVREKNEIFRNQIRNLESNLDNFGFPDFGVEKKWINYNNHIVPLTEEIIKNSVQHFGHSHLQFLFKEKLFMYTTMTTRGCPHKCTYCSNSYFLDIFKHKGKTLRFRSTEFVIEELEIILKMHPFVNVINIYDDDFLARPIEDLEKFKYLYKAKIGLPFCCMVSPWSYNRKKLDILLDAGLVNVQLGVQSGSQRINYDIYNRKVKANEIIGIINDLGCLKKSEKLKSYVIDIILDNPYETIDDQYETVKFFSKLPRTYNIQFFSLVFYPKTILSEMALKDGYVRKDDLGKKLMNKWSSLNKDNYSYYEFLLEFHRHIPSFLFKLLTYKVLFLFLRKVYFNIFFLSLHKLKDQLRNIIKY